ncbi:MAG: aldo/keto reductase [Kiritimatiellae bacterium]|nr:aldo/keto reductase [Kiritimatiellia bacterium]
MAGAEPIPDVRGRLGFGLMRLPREGGAIDLRRTRAMVDRFLDAGCTYFDTAYVYDGSEDAAREALVKRRPRDSFLLATKLAAWAGCKTREDALAQFAASLARTGAGHFDFYLFHNLGPGRTEFFDRFGLWDWALERRVEGRIRHFGFSFHSTPDELARLLRAHPEVEFVQLQINYADWDDPVVRARENLEVARRHGKPVVVMEPVKGGLLANPPDSVAAVLRRADPAASLPSWALRFAAGLDGVLVVLSGMSSPEQMDDNLAHLAPGRFRPFGEAELAVLAEARAALAAVPTVPCTSCGYCEKVCPAGVGIRGSIAALNQLTLYRNETRARNYEQWQVVRSGKKRASGCLRCGACENACPQRIAIRDALAKAAAAFA